MAYSFHSTVPFGSVYTGLTGTVGYQLYDADGSANGSRVTAGISELGTTGFYHVLLSLADGWVGSIHWDTGGASPIYGIEDVRAIMTDAASRTASKADVSGLATAEALAAAVTKIDTIDGVVDGIATAVDAIETFDPSTTEADTGVTWNTAIAWVLAAISGKTVVDEDAGTVAFYLANGTTIAFTNTYGETAGERTARTAG